MKNIKCFLTGVLLIILQLTVHSQSLPVGSTAIEDYFRRAQLLDEADSNVSFTIRPLFPKPIGKQKSVYYPDSTEQRFNLLSIKSTWQSSNGKLKVFLLPLSFQTQINSDHPYGWNDGAMVPAAGLQTLASAGFFAEYGPVTVQFKPELVLAENAEFDTFNKNHYGTIFARYYDIYNNIDLPVRFGESGYSKAYWGQSSIRLNYKSVSLGLSTENLWWGPGIQNSLLMSNTAPGFKHLTLNTSRPLKTPIGSFEGQLIAGRLENSGYAPLYPDYSYFGTNLYVPKPNNWRYLSGVIVTWQPKWVPGLFLGFDQSSQMYGKDLSGIKSYLPIFSSIKNVTAPDNPINLPDQRNSVFMRWLWLKEQAEVYFEYGHNNYSKDFLQTLLSPEESRAYIFGLRKILPFNKSRNENIVIGFEATQLQETSIDKIRAGSEWYVSKYIRQGYTNQGQVLGAGIGPGGNLQSLDVSWVKGLKRLGLQLERYVHNNDFYYYAYEDSQDWRRHWVDISIAASGEWNYKNFIFNAKVYGIHSIDYQWYIDPSLQKVGAPYYVNGQTAFNLQLQAGVTYRF